MKIPKMSLCQRGTMHGLGVGSQYVHSSFMSESLRCADSTCSAAAVSSISAVMMTYVMHCTVNDSQCSRSAVETQLQRELMIVLQASGKFDLKEPYYRQLNPQTSAAWPQQEQCAEQAAPQQQQQSYVQQMHADSAQMQQGPNYGYSAQQPGVQQYPVMGHVSQDSRQQSDGHQWNQQAYQNMWQ